MRSLPPLRFVMLAVAAALLLAACDDARAPIPEPARPDRSTTPTVASPTTTATPALVSCGHEVLAQGDVDRDARVRDCLWDAYSRGVAASFTSTRPTTEGDPITMHIEVLGSGDVRVTTDFTQDKFSAPADRVVRTYRCTTLTRSAPVTGQGMRFEVGGCPDGAGFDI